MNAPISFRLRAAAPESTGADAAVARALRVVAPLWPLATFAARSPWQFLEEHSFSAVARESAGRHGIPLYPALGQARAALDRGDIDGRVLDERLLCWLVEQGWPEEAPDAAHYLGEAVRGRAREIGAREAAAWQDLATTLEAPSLAAPFGLGRDSVMHPLLEATAIRYCKLWLGAPASAWPLPGAEDGLFAAWRAAVEHDPLLPRPLRAALTACPHDAGAVVAQALQGLDDLAQVALLEAHLLALPGWAGLLRWTGREAGDETAPLRDYLALRLAMAPALGLPAAPAAPERPDALALLLDLAAHAGFTPAAWQALPPARQWHWLALAQALDEREREKLLLEATELTYRRRLQARLATGSARAPAPAPEAQLVFCIDVRSEPLRRALEAAGPWATFGYAGFFGLPVRTRRAGERHTHAACPVIATPQADLHEIVANAEAADRLARAAGERDARAGASARLKQDPLASLALPELSGLFHGLRMLWHSFFPARWRDTVATRLAPARPATAVTLQAAGEAAPPPDAQQLQWVTAALRGIGLVRDFAPLVVVAGHGSASCNNPYAAKLECGACGGAAGDLNARLLARLCNEPGIRAGLRARGIDIPPGTHFIAALHRTSLDRIEWLDLPPAAGEAGDAWRKLHAALPAVEDAVRRRRLAALPPAAGETPRREAAEALRRAGDWSETRPEWGLARNAALLIASREFSAGADLDGRAFLHSYRWQDDPDGALLAALAAGPVTVGQWINLQYYASSVAPAHHGSGSKATQTVTAGLGVMQGNASDLLPGLPWQAVMADDRTPWHLPQRLLVVIEAPAAHVGRLLEQAPAFARKVRNGWLHLTSYDPETHAWKDWT